MTEVFVFDKKTQTQAAVGGPEIVLESASVVVLGVSRASIKQMTRKGQSLVVELAGNEKLVITNYFDTFEGQDNSLVVNEGGQLIEAVISEPVSLGGQLAVSYEPFQQAAAEALTDSSVLGKLSAAVDGLTPLSKGLLLGGTALGAIALFQSDKGGSGNHHGGSGGTPPEAVDTTPPEKATGLVTQTESDGKMTVNGNAEPGSTVEVKFPDGSTGTTVAKPDGSFKLTSKTPQPNGEFTTTVRDAAGNKDESVTGNYTASNTNDTQAPEKATGLVTQTESDGKMTVNGNAEPGSTVEVKFPDGSTGTTVAKPDGSFKLTSKTPQPNGEFTTTVRDAAGNKDESVTGNYTASNTDDTQAPEKATGLVTQTESDGKMTVNGNAEPGSTVEVKFPDGSTGTTVAKPDGSFKLTSKTPQPNGEFTTTVRDAAGNKDESVTGNYTASNTDDTQAPEKATGLVTQTESDGKMTVNGNAEPGSTVEVRFPDGSTGTTVAKPDGSFKLTSKTPQPNGEFTTTVRDAAGNKGESVTGNYTDSNTDDTQAPEKATGLVTQTESDGKMTVNGNAEPGSTVEVKFPDGSTGTTVAKPDGSFKLTSKTPQPNGEFTTTVRDAAGNKGESVTGNYTASNTDDTQAPDSPTNLIAVPQADGTAKVTGKAESNSTVKVTLPDGTVQETKAGPDGNFTLVSATPQPNGKVSAVATDAAGNTSAPAQVDFTASNSIDNKAPDAPTGLVALELSDGKVTVSGKAEPNSTVTVTFADGSKGSVLAQANGDFTLTSAAAQNTAGTISAIAKDAAGNASPAATLPFVPAPAPDAPVFTDISTDPVTGLLTIKGTAPANMKVQLTFPDTTVKDVITSASGGFSFASNSPQDAAQFSAVTINEISGRFSAVTVGIYDGNPNAIYEVTVDGYIDAVPAVLWQQLTSKPTNDPKPTLVGKYQGGSAADQVVILENGVQIALATMDRGTKTWSARLPTVTDGVHNYTVEIRNPLGTSKASAATSLTIDTHAPDAPTIDNIRVVEQGSSQEILLSASGQTTDNTPTFSGRAEAGSTVIFYHLNADGQEAEIGRTIATAAGTWSHTSDFLTNRQQNIYAKAQDLASNISALSNTVAISVSGPTDKPQSIDVKYIWSVDSAGDVDGDGFDDVASGSYNYGNGSQLLRGILQGNADIASTPVKFYNFKDDWSYHQAGAGDTNGDGFNDVISMYGDRSGTSDGPSRLYLGGGISSVEGGWSNYTNLGLSRFVASAGDLDGDGLMDVVLGGSGAKGQNTKSSIRFGTTGDAATGTVLGNFSFGAAQKEANGSKDAAYSGAQYVTSAGDFNGDGIGDIVTAGGITFGRSTRGTLNREADIEWQTGSGARELNQAQAVSGVGDVNGDGYADVALQDGRNVFVVFGGTLASSTIRLETNWLKANNRGFALDTSWVSTQPTTYSDIRGVGDVNGDGLADFAYSTYGNDSFTGSNDRQGLADQAEFKFSNSYVIFGKTSTDTIDVKNMLPREGIVSPRDQADGASIAGRMDVNGDGLADVHVGSYNGAGKLYLGGASLGAEPSVLVGAYGRAFGDKKSNFIVGSAGRDYLVGNGGTDVIYAGAGNDIIVLNQDNLAHLAAGFDATAGINGRLARVDGGNGIDTLEFDKEVSTVDLTTISNAGLGTIQTGVGLSRLANIERVDLHGTNKAKLTLELKDVMDMNAGLSVFSKESFSSALADEAVKRHQLVIDGTSDNTVQIKGREDWITAKATTVDSNGHLYDVYNTVGENKGQLLIEQGVNVVWA